MPHSPLQESIKHKLQDLLKEETLDLRSIVKVSNELAKLDTSFQRFSVDAKTLIHLGRDSIKDNTTALIELVKNSYDADANDVEVEVLSNEGNDLIRVADNGFGMTQEQLINNWLRIGYSSKRISKLSELGRRKTGEKGIGRISTDRLGANLELISKTVSDGIIGLRVNWDDFDVEGKDLSEIEIELFKATSINLPTRNGKITTSGTEIRISGLRQTWSLKNIENLYNELAALTSPFSKVDFFEISLKNDLSDIFTKRVSSEFHQAAEITLTAIYDGNDQNVVYSIKDKYSDSEKTRIVRWDQLLNRLPKREVRGTVSNSLSLGPVTIELMFFLRDASAVVNTNFKLADLRNFLDNNAGIKIYRDNFAVKPYGFPSSQLGFDWLGLGERKVRNPAGVGRAEDYMFNANQLVGAVLISRDSNQKLIDSAAREGLVESEEFSEMKALVMGTILILESHRADIYPEIKRIRKQKDTKSAYKETENIRSHLDNVKDSLATIKDTVKNITQSNSEDFELSIDSTISKVNDITEEVFATISELLNWQRVLNTLATMGISSAVFGHETESSISQFKTSVNAAKIELTDEPPNILSAIEELDKAEKHSKKVAAWGAYALTRIQSEKRKKRKIQIYKTIKTVIEELRPVFKAASVLVDVVGAKFYTNTYPMDVETILVNLITNSYTAVLLTTNSRCIGIEINQEILNGIQGFYFRVSDSGPGIAKEFEERIFEPLFSTKSISGNKSKSVGTGLGLTIVKSVVDELNGSVTFGSDLNLKGAYFKIWLPREE